jgi:hypothetical protein
VELLNATRMEAAYTLGLDPDGRERVVVVVKGTFEIPPPGQAARLATEQVPLVMADEFTGVPGFSAVLYESEFAPFKPRCDVLVNGSAHAPAGQPAYQVTVGLRVGPIEKFFDVVGDRVWENGPLGPQPSAHPPFTSVPITYDRAWGGVDVDPEDPERVDAVMANPVGVGHYPLSGGVVVGQRLPNTAELGKTIDAHTGGHRPMSFGAIGRQFASRYPLAGTYDQDWVDHVFPFLPADFDPLYHQSAPPDQHMDYPQGGEWVELTGLTPEGRTVFQLPTVQVPVEFTDREFQRQQTSAVIDTVIIEPGLGRFMMVWRASRPLRENLFELTQCVVGRMPRGWYRARGLGKEYYRSVADLVAARVEEGEE